MIWMKPKYRKRLIAITVPPSMQQYQSIKCRRKWEKMAASGSEWRFHLLGQRCHLCSFLPYIFFCLSLLFLNFIANAAYSLNQSMWKALINFIAQIVNIDIY